MPRMCKMQPRYVGPGVTTITPRAIRRQAVPAVRTEGGVSAARCFARAQPDRMSRADARQRLRSPLVPVFEVSRGGTGTTLRIMTHRPSWIAPNLNAGDPAIATFPLSLFLLPLLRQGGKNAGRMLDASQDTNALDPGTNHPGDALPLTSDPGYRTLDSVRATCCWSRPLSTSYTPPWCGSGAWRVSGACSTLGPCPLSPVSRPLSPRLA